MPTPWRFFVCYLTTATLEEREESQVRVRLDDAILLLLLRSPSDTLAHHICDRYEESLRWTYTNGRAYPLQVDRSDLTHNDWTKCDERVMNRTRCGATCQY